MAATRQGVARCCHCAARAARPFHYRPSMALLQQRRWQTTDAANPKIDTLVDQIGQLTLLETASLVSALKSKLNIPDMPMGNFSAGPAQAQAVAPPPEEEEEKPKAQEKTLFTVTLKSFEATAKPKVIKEIKAMLNLSLVESKKFAESAPKVMKENATKEDADKIAATMKALGADVAIE